VLELLNRYSVHPVPISSFMLITDMVCSPATRWISTSRSTSPS
jgi:hypothetical protein